MKTTFKVICAFATGLIIGWNGPKIKKTLEEKFNEMKKDSPVEDAGKTVADVAETAKDKAAETVDAAKDKAAEAVNTATEKVEGVVDAAKDKAAEVVDAAKEKGAEAAQKVADELKK